MGAKQFDYYVFIDYSENFLGYLIIEKEKIEEFLPKISKFAHYNRLKHQKHDVPPWHKCHGLKRHSCFGCTRNSCEFLCTEICNFQQISCAQDCIHPGTKVPGFLPSNLDIRNCIFMR